MVTGTSTNSTEDLYGSRVRGETRFLHRIDVGRLRAQPWAEYEHHPSVFWAEITGPCRASRRNVIAETQSEVQGETVRAQHCPDPIVGKGPSSEFELGSWGKTRTHDGGSCTYLIAPDRITDLQGRHARQNLGFCNGLTLLRNVAGRSETRADARKRARRGLLKCYLPYGLHSSLSRACVTIRQRVSPASVVTQPYDKITPETQERYYDSSPYNLVRMILGNREAEDHEDRECLHPGRQTFRDWRREGIFLQDLPNLPSTRYAQRFVIPGSPEEQAGTARVHRSRARSKTIPPAWSSATNRRWPSPRPIGCDLLRATRAHFGQIFMLYNDTGEIDGLLAQETAPTTEVTDEYGVLQPNLESLRSGTDRTGAQQDARQAADHRGRPSSLRNRHQLSQ